MSEVLQLHDNVKTFVTQLKRLCKVPLSTVSTDDQAYSSSTSEHAKWFAQIINRVSIEHAECTFLGARLSMSVPWFVAIGMMQKGVSRTPTAWRSHWNSYLPNIEEDDFTIWLMSSLIEAFGTGQGKGPSLLYPPTYSPGIDKTSITIITKGYRLLNTLSHQSFALMKNTEFKAPWIFDRLEAGKASSVLTSGTYL